MAAKLPPVPPSLRAVQHYLKTASEHDNREAAVSYYCRLYAVQKSLTLDKKSPDAVKFITTLMDILETTKQQSSDNEAIQNETVGQAHIEQYALKLFLYADNEDRAARFGKNVVKSFYTAGMLFDVLETFGELTDEIEKNKKYAKWKATYIHKCLKEGITPEAGPMNDEETGTEYTPGTQAPITSSNIPSQPSKPSHSVSHSPTKPENLQPPSAQAQASVPSSDTNQWVQPQSGSYKPKSGDFEKATKQCKHAISAMQYEDTSAAIACLNKALKILSTGRE